MCISKRFNNTGKSGNHGMQEVDLLKRRMIEDKLEEEKSQIVVSCVNGCDYTLLGEKIPLREAMLLEDHIQKNHLCPFCRTSNGSINFQYCAENQHHLREYSFVLGDKKYYTIYTPRGYRFLPPEEDND